MIYGNGWKACPRSPRVGPSDPMPSAVLHLEIVPKRMLTKAEAAHYCGRSVNTFEAECPVVRVRFANGQLRYDTHDLDAWLDQLKAGSAINADDILGRLG